MHIIIPFLFVFEVYVYQNCLFCTWQSFWKGYKGRYADSRVVGDDVSADVISVASATPDSTKNITFRVIDPILIESTSPTPMVETHNKTLYMLRVPHLF